MNTQPTWSDSPVHEQIRTMSTDTPETDAMVSADQHHLEDDNFFSASVYWRICDLARRLERKLTAVTEQRDEARETLKTGGMLNIIDRAHHERAAAIRERDEAREQLAAVTEQRNTLAENDLKAIHEVEKVLESDHRYAYDDYCFVLYEKHGNTVSFTAAQRIEAIVCIMKKWTLDGLGWPTDDLPETTMNTPHHTWSDSPIHEQIRTMSADTPETFKSAMWSELGWTVDIDFARKLERERDEERETLAELRASVLDLSHPNIKMILSERNEAREETIRTREFMDHGFAKARDELAAVTEQRDEWKAKYLQQNKDLGHELRDPNGTIWSECKRLQAELTAVTEQRDVIEKKLRVELGGHPNSELWGEAGLIAATMRCVDALAEALRYIVGDSVTFLRNTAIEKADEALQSLTPKP